MTRGLATLVLVASCAQANAVLGSETLEEYAPVQPVTGSIRVWTNAETEPLLRRWQEGFQRLHPHATFEIHSKGSDVALAGLYTSLADIALIGRVADAPELKAFEWIFRYKPEPIEVANGSEGEPGRSPPLAAYVHATNPLSKLSLAQLDAAFGKERLLGAPRAVRSWADLGVRGKLAPQPIQLYLVDTESGTGRYFREQVLGGSRKLNWERLREFTDSGGITRPAHDESSQILAALSKDPKGLAVAPRLTNPPASVKELALARDGEHVSATRADMVVRRYPLTRVLHAYVNRKPGAPMDSRVGEFLRYVLSRQGQAVVAGHADFLPLSVADARRQVERIR